MKTGTRRKRLTKAERAIAKAERLARSLADAPVLDGSPALTPPAFIADPRLAPALRFWGDMSPHLVKIGTLQHVDRFAFAMLCVYAADFVEAQDDILAKGYSVMVKTISGDRMPRENPSVWRRDFAAKMVLDMSKAFGLTKLDRMNLTRAENRSALSPLFPHEPPDADAPKPADPGGDLWRGLLRPRAVN